MNEINDTEMDEPHSVVNAAAEAKFSLFRESSIIPTSFDYVFNSSKGL